MKDYGLVKKYELEGKSYFVVSDGYAANLAVGSGTPIEVMDRTFSAAILALNYLHRNDFDGLIPLPRHIESTEIRNGFKKWTLSGLIEVIPCF